jgi:uncharacterized protein YodC (DUF2158 family)
MATKFKKGDSVRLKVTVPAGHVQGMRLDDGDGTIMCMIQWTDAEGQTHEREFAEDDLERTAEPAE